MTPTISKLSKEIDPDRLEKARRRGEAIIARCPACAELGGDKSAGHLKIWPDGRFACIKWPGPEGREHRRRILELVGREARGERPPPPRPAPPPADHKLTRGEAELCAAMAEALLRDPLVIERFARARGWRPETIRGLALDVQLGAASGKPVFLFPTGAKVRQKPLERGAEHLGAPFRQLLGKPSIWRGDRILPSTKLINITEGETDCVTLIDAGRDNGTSELCMAVPGATAWQDRWAAKFAGIEVRLWPDNDEAGRRMVATVGASLIKAGAKVFTMKGIDR